MNTKENLQKTVGKGSPNAFSSGTSMSKCHRYRDGDEEYIYVRLNDSAYRAIHKYQEDEQNKQYAPKQGARIQFSGKSGIIEIPLAGDNNAENSDSNSSTNDNITNNLGIDGTGRMQSRRRFHFTMDHLDNFECREKQSKKLDALRPLPVRKHIDAKDDIVKTTRPKNAISNETEKVRCIHQIKPHQPSKLNLARKVKTPYTINNRKTIATGCSSLHNKNSSGEGNDTSNPMNTDVSISKLREYLIHILSIKPFHMVELCVRLKQKRIKNPDRQLISSILSEISILSHNKYILRRQMWNEVNENWPYLTAQERQQLKHRKLRYAVLPATPLPGRSILSQSLTSTHTVSTPLPKILNKQPNVLEDIGEIGATDNINMDVSERELRVRLIHLLALKPYHMVNLYTRLNNEGIKNPERHLLNSILSEISILSHSKYILRRQMWNEVNENWPYFTAQELQQLKRRKQLYLPTTPFPGSSALSQSLTSTRTVNPPHPKILNKQHNVLKDISAHTFADNRNDIGSPKPIEYDESMLRAVKPTKRRISLYEKQQSKNTGSGNSRDGSSNIGGIVTSCRPHIKKQQSHQMLDDEENIDYKAQQNPIKRKPSPSGSKIAIGEGEDGQCKNNTLYTMISKAEITAAYGRNFVSAASSNNKKRSTNQNQSKGLPTQGNSNAHAASNSKERTSNSRSTCDDVYQSSSKSFSNGNYINNNNATSNADNNNSGNNAIPTPSVLHNQQQQHYQNNNIQYQQPQEHATMVVPPSSTTATHPSPTEQLVAAALAYASAHGNNFMPAPSTIYCRQPQQRATMVVPLPSTTAMRPSPTEQLVAAALAYASAHANNIMLAPSTIYCPRPQQRATMVVSTTATHPSPTEQLAAAALAYASAHDNNIMPIYCQQTQQIKMAIPPSSTTPMDRSSVNQLVPTAHVCALPTSADQNCNGQQRHDFGEHA